MNIKFPIIYNAPAKAWTPAQLPTAIWLDATDSGTITLNGATVSQWNDKSGNGRDVLQSTAANQPAWGAGRNLLLWSEQFQNAAWAATNSSVVANQAIAPDGAITADKIIDNTTNSAHYYGQNVTIVSGTTYTFSAYVKAGERQFATVQLGGSGFGNQGVAINLVTGANVIRNSPVASSVTSIGNGWWRVSVSATATGTSGLPLITIDDSLNNQFYAGTGTSGIYVWGAQLNPGSTADTYQKTEGTAFTVATGINGKPSLVFDGVNDYLLSSKNLGIAGNGNFSFFAVHAFPWVSLNVAMSFGTSGRYHHMCSATSGAYWTGYEGQTQLGTYSPTTPSTAYMLGVERTGNSGASWNVRQNGTALTVTAGNNNPVGLTDGKISIGAFVDGTLNSATNWGELILVPTVLGQAERQLIEGYLAWKWGLVGSLPSDHPYKNSPPIG